MILTRFFSIGAFFVLAACTSQQQLTGEHSSLYDKKWLLKKIHTGTVSEDVNTKAFIKFDKVKGSAGGNGSCNSFGSNFTIQNNEVSFTNIFSTKMYCEAVQKTEDAFFKQLVLVNRFEITDNQLLLYRDSEILLEFQAEKENQ